MQGDRRNKINKKKLFFSSLILIIVIPALAIVGRKLFNDRRYNLISIIIAFLSCIPFFVRFESKKPKTREIMVIVVMASITVTSRIIFAPIPGFKPVTALTAITGMAFGPEAGFLTGSISALVSNMFFGQGPWTPFQMIAWGLLGFIAGLLSKFKLMENKFILIAYSIFAKSIFFYNGHLECTFNRWFVFLRKIQDSHPCSYSIYNSLYSIQYIFLGLAKATHR